jgi:SEC-C motif-containing protein
MMQNRCYCDSGKSFSECCEPIIFKKAKAKTALELMRSRYSAYVLKNGQYLYDTCSEKLKNREDIEAINADKTQWICLKIESFSENTVTFMAYYKEDKDIFVMKERSFFVREDEKIRYDSGEMIETVIGRNETCPCGSGKKYKKCCG